MSHGFLEVTIHKVILHCLQEFESVRQVILHDLAVTYLYYIIKQLMTYVSEYEVLLNSKLNHIDLHFMWATST